MNNVPIDRERESCLPSKGCVEGALYGFMRLMDVTRFWAIVLVDRFGLWASVRGDHHTNFHLDGR